MSDRLTDLATEPHILLAAVDDARNVPRSYAISRSRNLFGWYLVTSAWGRKGQVATSRLRAFPDDVGATAFVRQLMARRATAPRRIGIAYTPVSHSGGGFDE